MIKFYQLFLTSEYLAAHFKEAFGALVCPVTPKHLNSGFHLNILISS